MLTLMSSAPALRLFKLGRFLRTSSLARSVLGVLGGAIVLLLLVNVSTFVLIRRTAEFNKQVEAAQLIRRSARSTLINVQDAETAQRGFLLTGQSEFLDLFDAATEAVPEQLQKLDERVKGDALAEASAAKLRSLLTQKDKEMEAALMLARQGRIGEAVLHVRTGRGKVLMDQLRAEVEAVDARQTVRVRELNRKADQSDLATIAVNAIAGLLILILAGIMALVVRRYLSEIHESRDALDRANAGLEEKVRRRTAALTRANEEVQRFAYIVSHDLRSPLVNVMGYTAELEQAGKTLDKQLAKIEVSVPELVEAEAVLAVREDMPEAVGFIRASTEKMDRLINAILKLSRDGRRNLAPDKLDMTTMVQGIADSVRHQTEAANAEIIVEPLDWIISDRLSIEQIFGNLVDNAVKYLDNDRPGRIVISGRDQADGGVEYVIADNGRGIAPRDHERIFELFRRSGRQDRPGEGLGLAFVRNSVRRLGGSIDIESELGTGSTFRLKFPKRLVPVEAGDLE